MTTTTEALPIARTPQEYVDQQLAWHQRRLDVKLPAGDLDAFTVHVRAILELRKVAATQYRPRLHVPEHLKASVREMLAEDDQAPRSLAELILPTRPLAELALTGGPDRIEEVRVGPFVHQVPTWDTEARIRDTDPREWDTDADEAFQHRLQAARQLPHIETPNPATSPIYAQTRRTTGIDPAGGRW